MVELFINGTASAVGQLTLYGDEPLSLNISVSDIKDISKRNSTFSQTFTLPADKNNNILLNHIFNIGADSSFDPTKKTQCFILNDSMPVFNGQFQLTKINVKNRNVISYESVVYGEMIDLVKALGDRLIIGNANPNDDLDFSELDHNRSAINIEDSWIADTKTLGYYYPLIDYGYDLTLNELNSGILSINVYNGDASSGTLNTLIDTTALWAINSYATYDVNIISGQGAGQIRTILSNTGTTLTTTTNWSIIPDSTSTYNITRIDTTNPYNSTGSGLNPNIFKPALSNYYLFNKIISNVGFDTNPGFLETEIFTETIIPFNGVDNLENPDVDSFRALIPQPLAIQNFGGISFIDLPFTNDTTNGGFDYGNNYNILTYEYTSPLASVQQFNVDLSYSYNVVNFLPGTFNDDSWYIRFFRSSLASGVSGAGPNCYCQINYRVSKISTPVPTVYDIMSNKFFTVYGPILDNGATPPPSVATTNGLVYTNNAWRYPALPGETFWVEVSISNQPSVYQILDEKTSFHNKIYTNGVVNNYIQMNDFIPKNIKQVDYIKSVITMFNLMVIPDKNNTKRLTFIPRNDYYASGEVKDWTNKIDHTEKIEETLISEQQSKSIRLTYKEDKDFYNANYKEETNTIYGEYIEVIDNEWITGEKKIEVIFSPTPVDKVLGSTDVYLPKIAKRDEKSGIYGRTDFNIRFLRKNPIPLLTTDTIQLLGMPPRNTYPYCGHLDHPINPLVDYNFGAVSYVYYEGLSTMTPHNLVYDYWKEYLDDINDKNSKLIKCKIYLTPNDIAQFNYNDSIYVEGLTDDGGHYFNVNKINYIPTSNLPSTIELIKVNRRPDVEAPSIEISQYVSLPPIKYIDLGRENNSQSAGTIILGDNNTVGYGNENSFIIGNNNTIQNNISNVVLINSNNQTITEPFTTIVGNTYFPQEGDSYTLFNDIDSGLDEIINPFAKNILNDIDSGLDAVRNIGGQSVISDIDSGNSGLNS